MGASVVQVPWAKVSPAKTTTVKPRSIVNIPLVILLVLFMALSFCTYWAYEVMMGSLQLDHPTRLARAIRAKSLPVMPVHSRFFPPTASAYDQPPPLLVKGGMNRWPYPRCADILLV